MRLLASALLWAECSRLAGRGGGVLYNPDYLEYDPVALMGFDYCVAACRGDTNFLSSAPLVDNLKCSNERSPEQLALDMGHTDAAALISSRGMLTS